MILDQRWIALTLQYSTLIGETGGLLAIVSRWARPVIGLLLIGFHIGAISVFSWGFHANVAMLILFFFPCRALDQRPGRPLGETLLIDVS